MKTVTKSGAALTLLFIGWLSVLSLTAQDGSGLGTPITGSEASIPELLDFKVQRLDLPSDAEGTVSTAVSLDGTQYGLTLHLTSMRSESFQLLVQGEDGSLREVEPPRVRTYRGSVDGIPGSRVAASLSDGNLSALITFKDGPTWAIQPLAELDRQAATGAHLIYRSQDFVPLHNYRCGTDALAPLPSINTQQQSVVDGEASSIRIAEIAIDADFDFFQSRNIRSIDRAVRDIESVMNGVVTIYQKDVGITYEISTIVVRTAEPDPYSSTNPSELLREFQREWNRNLRDLPRDVTHLMTGKNLQGNTIGISFLSTICSPFTSYGLSQSLFTSLLSQRVCLTAHELGHNWSARHCDNDPDCGIMCSRIAGCDRNCSQFGSRATTSITRHRNTRSCLSELPEPIDPPLFDDFSSPELDTSNWLFGKGVQINSDALEEPSEPLALNLNSAGDGPYQNDEIRSNFILLGDKSEVTISFFTEHRGVEDGEALVIEYLAKSRGNLQWKEISRLTSDGVDQGSFSFHSFTLDASNRRQRNAFHDEFRIRLRTEGNETDDNWYIDDVQITSGGWGSEGPSHQMDGTLTYGC